MDCEIIAATKITISSAGSARKPSIISRRAPSVPKAVPTSMAASARNTRAVASRPTSAMLSAAVVSGSRVPIEGMIAAAATMVANTTYGAARNSPEAFVRDHGLLVEQLVDAAIGLQQARCTAVLQPGAALVHPADEGRRRQRRAKTISSSWVSGGETVHSTIHSSTIRVTKLYSR